jgi:hypothetical protein
MTERTRTIKLLGRDTDVADVDIVERKDHVAEFKLSDGSVIKFTAAPTQVVRVLGVWNAEGNPVYIVMNGTVTTVMSAPDNLRRPGN